MDLGIKGKWALVGGASKGLGYGCAQSLAREGVNVVIVARGAEALEAAAKELRKFGTTIIAAAVDITTTEGREVIWSIKGGPGKNYDIVVTNAGGPPPGDFRNWDREAWIKAVDANMLTPIELLEWRAFWFDRIYRWRGTYHQTRIEQCDDQQPIARRLRHRPSQRHDEGCCRKNRPTY